MDELYKSSFPGRFSLLLEEKKQQGIDQQKIADDLLVSKQTITSWKSGARSPKKPVQLQIAAYFDVNPGWLNGVGDERGHFSDKFVKLDVPIPVPSNATEEEQMRYEMKKKLFDLVDDATIEELQILISSMEVFLLHRRKSKP